LVSAGAADPRPGNACLH